MIELLERLGYYPRFCVWELTLACDMRCQHCGSFAGTKRPDELTFDEQLSVAEQLIRLGCEKVTLGGGEPTLHPRWYQLGKYLTDGGVRVNIISNGWGWDERQLRHAFDANLANIAFSLDGFEQAHDQVRKPGSFARVVAAAELSIAAGMPTSIVTHINQLNCRDLGRFRDLLGGLGISSWQLQLGNPSGAMGEHQELVIQPEELLWIIPEIARLRADDQVLPEVLASDNVGYFGEHEKALRDQGSKISFWIGCRAGCQVIGIESNGNIKGCLSLPSAMHGRDRFLEGNLRERSMAEIWSDEDSFAFNRRFSTDQLTGFCGVCRYQDICRGGCAWTAFSHTEGTLDNPYCFYRQCVENGRLDLLGEDDEPSEAELAWAQENRDKT